MSARTVRPGVAHGTVRAPPSKSYTHRALVAAHLSGRRYIVDRPLVADDTRATASAIRRLGSSVRVAAGRWTVRPDRRDHSRRVSINCGESGTTLRLVAPLAALSGRRVRLEGRGRLPRRPISALFRALEHLGATCRTPADGSGLPAVVEGPLHGGTVRLDASQSSQFASALLLALPTVQGPSRLDLVGPIVSEPYIEATLRVLDYHGVEYHRRGRRFYLPGGQRYRGTRFDVPGDASSAAYLWGAAALTGGRVSVTGVPSGWPQADLAILELLGRAGANVRANGRATTVEGRPLHPFTADLTRSPDMYPLAGVIAAAAPGTSQLTGAPHIVFKESDRRAGTIRIVRALGAEVRSDREGLTIRGRAPLRPVRLPDLDDHRLVMSAAVGALAATGPSSIGDASAVRKSFPDFWSVLDALREGADA